MQVQACHRQLLEDGGHSSLSDALLSDNYTKPVIPVVYNRYHRSVPIGTDIVPH